MTLPSIREIVEGNTAHFSYYRKGYLYYTVSYRPHMSPRVTYSFPVPIDDTGDASFNVTEKAIHLMRYIRLAIKDGSFAPVPNAQA